MISQIGDWLAAAKHVYWFLALVGSLLFFVQFILTLFGMGGDGMDIDGDGTIEFGEHADTGFGDFKLFSVRAIVAFVTFFGWGGVIWGKTGWGGFFAAVTSGLVMMFITALILFLMMKLQHSGNISPNELVGKTGSVYLTIPAGKVETGKVTVALAGVTKEIIAVADQDIPTGTSVKVVENIDGKRFLVEKI